MGAVLQHGLKQMNVQFRKYIFKGRLFVVIGIELPPTAFKAMP